MSHRMLQMLAYHGWGFDRTCWQAWSDRWAGPTLRFAAFDRGYFGHPFTPVWEPAKRTILIAHSYGLHLCPIEQLQAADALVVINSFLQFHPSAPSRNRRSQQMLGIMMRQFCEHPQHVLQTFRGKCYDPVPYSDDRDRLPLESLQIERLQSDLEALNTASLDPQWLRSIPQIVLLQGGADRIVAPQTSGELVTQLAQHNPDALIQRIEILSAGHALPFTHEAECWIAIQSVIEQWMAE